MLGHRGIATGAIAAIPTAGGISGTLSVTLADVTLAATATLPIKGTLSSTLASATLSAQGALPIKGTLSSTLAALTLSADSDLLIKGELTKTLADVTLIATGASSATISGTLDVTLADATLAATGALPIEGSLSATLADATLVATGIGTALSPIVGTLAVTLADATLSATNVRSRQLWFSTGGFRTPTGLGTVTAGKEETAVRLEFYSPPKPSNYYTFALPGYWTKDDGSVPSEFPLPNAYSVKGVSMMADREANGNWETVVLFDSGSAAIVVDPGVDDVGPYTHEAKGYITFAHDLPPNTRCQVTFRLSAPLGGFVPVAIRARNGTNETAKIDATDAPLTNTGLLTGSDGRFSGELFCPAFGVSAFDNEGLPVILISGDSIPWGKNENENILVDSHYGGMGFIARGLEDDTRSNRMPFCNMCVPGMGPGELTTFAPWSRKLSHVARCPTRPYNTIITEHYNNLGGTYAAYKAALQAYHAILKAESIRWGDTEAPMYQTGPIPRPGSTDWCTTLEGQGTSAGDVYPTGNRWLFDADLRLGGVYTDIDGLIDINPYIAANMGDERDKLRLPGYVTTLALQALSGVSVITVTDRAADDIEYVVIDPTGSVQAKHITDRILLADGTMQLTLESAISFTYAAGQVIKSSFGGDSVGLHPNTPGHKLLAAGVIDWKNQIMPFVINAGGHSAADARRAEAWRRAQARQNAQVEAKWREQKEREALEFFAKHMEAEGITIESLLGVDYHEIGLDDDEEVLELLLLNN
jgi:hypothetical protein